MNKVLIFENEYADLEPTFKAINLLEFENKLIITQYNTSQELDTISHIDLYDAIIIDIDLSLKSHKDGFGIIQDIAAYNPKILKKVFILTGSSKIKEKLIELGYQSLKIISKPVDMDQVTKYLKYLIK